MLDGEEVSLNPIKSDDINQFLKWLNDPEITKYLNQYLPLTKEMEEEWLNNLPRRRDLVIFSIVTNQEDNTGKTIGNCSVLLDWKNRVGKCGIMIGEKEFLGKGYGTEALSLLIIYSFNTLNLNRLELEVHDFNIRAYKSYLKLGFREEGRRRKADYINGKYRDSIIMGLLKEEWFEGQ